MKNWALRSNRLGLLVAAAAVAGGISVFWPGSSARAEDILQEQGTLSPAQDEYTFSGTAGQSVTITMTSADFDTVLSLVGPDGQDVAFNDDYARSLNSTIVVTLPSTGSYKIVARSFSGNGGRYSVTVRPSTPYEQAYSTAWTAYSAGDFEAAIAGFEDAIAIDPNQPAVYLDRADARWGQFYMNIGPEMNPDNPPQPSDELKASIIADYERAASLYEAAGDTDMAQGLRDQIEVLRTGNAPY
ncbi:MAG TPA: pre-peptidase C-terminal domain-containing protein [Chroococcidiopsis sp.]